MSLIIWYNNGLMTSDILVKTMALVSCGLFHITIPYKFIYWQQCRECELITIPNINLGRDEG